MRLISSSSSSFGLSEELSVGVAEAGGVSVEEEYRVVVQPLLLLLLFGSVLQIPSLPPRNREVKKVLGLLLFWGNGR